MAKLGLTVIIVMVYFHFKGTLFVKITKSMIGVNNKDKYKYSHGAVCVWFVQIP